MSNQLTFVVAGPNMKHLLFSFALTLIAGPVWLKAAPPPNIVFIIADDLGWGDLGCYGQTKIRTPHLDRMAAEGLRFTQHYSGNAVCAPSRCVLMTGKHPGHADIRDNRGMASKSAKSSGGIPETEGQEPIKAETLTMAEALTSAGYATGGFGKWGLGGPQSDGSPLKQGFQRWFGYNCQSVAHNFYPVYLWDNDKTINLNNPSFPAHDSLKPGEDPNKAETYKRFQGSEYSADLIAEQARHFVRANKDNPFFLYWPTTVPHVALQVPDDSLKEYEGLWDDPPYTGGKGYIPHFKPKAAYAAMITRMDREIGQMMALIKELGLDERTIFVFTSDNGPLNGEHQGLAGTDAIFFNSAGGLRNGKGTLYEGGFRVPGIVRWSGKIKPGITSDRVTGFEDWLPTLLDLTGQKDKIPSDIDGISFAPTLRGEAQPERPFLFREFPSYTGQRCIRVGNWKLIHRGLAGGKKAKGAKPSIELFDIGTDPHEEKNVASQNPEVVAKLTALMKEQHKPSSVFPFAVLDAEKK
ncbi:MAG: arylsulfatase [Verrucomicrobiaceae bacterium]|nr:arylsulfatase [Verrucomicrobiaceae bacterium]